MNIISMIFIFILFCIILLVLLFLSKKFLKDKEESEYIIKFERYIILFEFYLNKAYEIIHKDRILIYSLEATKLNDDEFRQVAKDFGKLFIQLVGPTLQQKLTKFYGNEETLMFNIIEFFNTRFEDDEIRKTAVDNLAVDNFEDEKK